MSQNEFRRIKDKKEPIAQITESTPSSDSYVDPLGELSNYEYFNVNKEIKLDFVIQKVKAKPSKILGVGPIRIFG
jgi:hypothetical protein